MMSSTRNALLSSLLGHLDPVSLCQAVGMTPDPWQKLVLRSDAPRILLCCSRQIGKSTVAGIRAVHTALHQPNSLTLVIAPSQRQAMLLFRSILVVYRKFGTPVAAEAENAMSLTLENGSRIVALPADQKTVRGFAAVDLILIDEASQVDDDLYEAIRPMLAVSGGQLLVMSTPYGRRGWFYRATTANDTSWERFIVPATLCPRISADFLARERADLGEHRFREEYMAEFSDSSGSVFAGADLALILSDLPAFDLQKRITS